MFLFELWLWEFLVIEGVKHGEMSSGSANKWVDSIFIFVLNPTIPREDKKENSTDRKKKAKTQTTNPIKPSTHPSFQSQHCVIVMNLLVLPQMTRGGERLDTPRHVTHIGSLPSMQTNMAFQISRLRECTLTKLAFVWTLFCVSSNVDLQCISSWE